MSTTGAALFSWVQRARFYEAAHRSAVELLPRGDGRTWVDVGCGPGLVTRLAAERGYRATGIDLDAAMVRAARRNRANHACTFERAGLDELTSRPRADVVSAASLVCAVPDARHALLALWTAVVPGGSLLVVETTTAMSPDGVKQAVGAGAVRPHPALRLWSIARHDRAVDRAVLDSLEGADVTRTALLGGLLEAIVATRPTDHRPARR